MPFQPTDPHTKRSVRRHSRRPFLHGRAPRTGGPTAGVQDTVSAVVFSRRRVTHPRRTPPRARRGPRGPAQTGSACRRRADPRMSPPRTAPNLGNPRFPVDVGLAPLSGRLEVRIPCTSVGISRRLRAGRPPIPVAILAAGAAVQGLLRCPVGCLPVPLISAQETPVHRPGTKPVRTRRATVMSARSGRGLRQVTVRAQLLVDALRFFELVFEDDDATGGLDGGALINELASPGGDAQLVAGVTAVAAF